MDKAVKFVLSCHNFDGGFGGMPNAESHAAYVFCCVGALAIAGALNKFDKGALSYWLSRRQTAMGGFNGRPEKLLDVCYSWWVQSSLCILKKQNQVNLKNLQGYVYQCQDDKGTFFSYGGCAIIDYVGFAIGLGMRLMCFIRF